MAAATSPPPGPWLFYHVQNERGDSPQHPNACRLAPSQPGRLVLSDVLAAFPLASTGSFHFRFQVASPEHGRMYLDVSHPEDSVPTMGGNVIAKVLRLGEWAWAWVGKVS